MRGALLACSVFGLVAAAAPAAADPIPWLGISFTGGPDDPLMVTEVYPGTGASRAGILIRDIIIAVDDTPVMAGMASPGELLRMMVRRHALGDRVRIRVARDAQTLDLTVRLTGMPPSGELLELRLAGSPLPPMPVVDRHDGTPLGLDGRPAIMVVVDARCDACAAPASAMVQAAADVGVTIPVRTVVVGSAEQVASYLTRVPITGVVGRVERSPELGPSNPVLSGMTGDIEGAILVVDQAGVVQFAASTADFVEVRAGALAAAARVQQRLRRPRTAGIPR